MLALGERVRWEAGGSVRSRLGKIYPRKKCCIFGGLKTGLPFQPLATVKTAGRQQYRNFELGEGCSERLDGGIRSLLVAWIDVGERALE